MVRQTKKQQPGFPWVSNVLTADLKGKQSVRATFKLSNNTIQTLAAVAAHLGIRQKSLFDHLLNDVQTLHAIALEVQEKGIRPPNECRPKTYVISRKSYAFLEQIVRELHASRDAVLESCVQRLLPIIASEKKKHAKRTDIHGQFIEYVTAGREIFNKARALLGEDDPVADKIAKAIFECDRSLLQISAFMEKSKIIEKI
jgi:DNA-binding MarR family transcriptional regulator